MATIMSARHWGSDDSIKFLEETSSSRLDFVKSLETPHENKLVPVFSRKQTNFLKQAPKRKSFNVPSKGENLRVPKRYEDEFLEPSHVKVSALLYEITERTNKLAQPRVRLTGKKSLQTRQIPTHIPEASQRIIELSRPRTIHQKVTKPVGYVSPGALTAVATQRIIELSKPKKKRRLKVAKKRKCGYGAYNSRILSKLYRGKSWCHMSRAKRRSDRVYNCQRPKKKRTARRTVRSSNSNRTIIMVDLSPRTAPRTIPKRTRHG